ncbi:MAG: hypothetical protein ACPK85_04470 [Methanosarcina sp.]
MSIPLPNLYTKKFNDISDEMLAAIPKYTDKWTNHNPSDPGITILEMLAWIADTTLYRIDRIPEETYITFLRLVAGAAGSEDVDNLLKKLDLDQKSDLDHSHKKILTLLKEVEDGKEKTVEEIKAAVLVFLSSRFRAVTEEDFCSLAIEATDQNDSSPKVKRAIVSSKGTKVEIIIVPDNWAEYEDLTKYEDEKLPKTEKEARYKVLTDQVTDYLSPRKLIGTVIKVKIPVFSPVKIDIEILSSPHMRFENVAEDVINGIRNYLDPFVGGPEGKGWPYGKSLTVYKVAQLVEETEGVEIMISLIFDGDKDLKVKETGGFFVPTVNVTQNVKKEGK